MSKKVFLPLFCGKILIYAFFFCPKILATLKSALRKVNTISASALHQCQLQFYRAVSVGFPLEIGRYYLVPQHSSLYLKKSRIQETKHHSTDADSSTDTKKILPATPWSLLYKLLIQKYKKKCLKKKLKMPNWFNYYWFFKPKLAKKTFFCGKFTPLISTNFQMWDHFFPLLFPRNSESLRMLDIGLWKVGAKIYLNSTSKVNTRTNRQTETHTDKPT